MATRTLIIDLSKGTGGEPMYGMVTVQRTRATSEGTFEVLPWETKLKLFNGVATITEAVTDGSGPFYDSAYLIRVQNGYCAPRWGFMAALPDGTTPISTGDMPKVNPITGEGIYMDAQEWNALYGDLPDRVTSLETGKANTVHTHVIGDVTGLQPALNAKGNATMRVDTSVGTRVFLNDGSGERMVAGDTGWRDLRGNLLNGWTADVLQVRRVDNTVILKASNLNGTAAAGTQPYRVVNIGGGLSSGGAYFPFAISFTEPGQAFADTHFNVAQGKTYGATRPAQITWTTGDPWPTSLPGIPA